MRAIMSNQRQSNTTMTFHHMCRKWSCFLAAILTTITILSMTTTTYVECAKLDAQIKLLINDEALLLQQPKQIQPAATPATASAYASGGTHDQESAHADDENQQHFDMYRSSELRRLSYETIHRILRDENEPIYRREDAELRYYQKRSYQPTHEVFRRSADPSELAAIQPLTQQLNMSCSNLTTLPAVLTSGAYTQLRSLDLSFNALRQVNLTLLPQLHLVDLAHNQITALPLEANSSLIALNLNGNRIKFANAPANCSHLRQLHLCSNEIENLTSLNLSALNSLEVLDLSCNHIENLETAFFPQRMHNLKYLNLAHNQLGCIYRESFYNLLSLNTLILSQNNITDIDYETFLALPNLQYLDLSHNQLRGESIRALQGIPDLVGLSIAYNSELGGFMQEFVASWSLKELDASGTGLCQIPAALAQSVRTLKLTDNWLKIINCGDLDSYPLLQYLDLSHSRIEDIEDDALGRLEILEVLFLDGNNLRKVPLSLPTSLQHLFLQHNQIMDIQVQAFQALSNLQTLDLSHNKLLYLPALPLPKLLTLNLQSSELRGINQAIVHTLPRLRDMLLEDNPIKCSDLLGIAEWASPCRIGERTAVGQELNELGQQESLKIDLKQQFVQMHNFFENFKGKCAAQLKQANGDSELLPPPACAIELDADVEITTIQGGQTETEVITFNLPSESLVKANSSNAEQVYEEQEQELRTTLEATQNVESSVQNNEAKATTTETTISGSKSSLDMRTTSKTLQKSVATTTTSSKILDIKAAPTNLARNNSKISTIATTTTISSSDLDTDTEDANHVELETNPINSKASKATTAAAINSKQQEQVAKEATTTMITSTSALNKSKVVGGTENVAENSNKATAVTTKIDAPTTTESTVYMLLPQTISSTIQSSSNYIETTTVTTTTTTTGLLSQQGLKTSAAIEQRSNAVKNDSNYNNNNAVNINNNNYNKASNSKQQQQQQLNFNGISGQLNIDAKPTTTTAKTKTTLASNHQQQLQLEQHQQLARRNATHRHEPIPMHIKDRHLIGTPLLMHKGHNILVDPEEQLILATATTMLQPKTTPTTTSSTTTMTTTTMTTPLDTATAAQTARAGKGSQSADILDLSQNSNGLKAPHFTSQPIGVSDGKATEQDKLPAPEAIKPATNEQPQHDPVKLSVNDKIDKTEEIIKTNVQQLHNEDENRALAPKNPKIRADKKKLSLTMKKMTLTKVMQSATATAKHSLQLNQQLQPQPQQHQYLNTPRRENEASDTTDWQLFKELKTELDPDRIPAQLPPHKQHATINTPVNNELQQHVYPELPQLAAVEQQHTAVQQQQEQHAGISKSEQWLDIRKPATPAGHPGLVILVSSIAFIVLLLGLIQVYRCDKPWRQRRELRPHQRPFSDEDSRDSFLSYNNQQQQPLNVPLKWHHSTRLLPPHRSPLHNLHVRELQKSSAVEMPQVRCAKSQHSRLTMTSNKNVSGSSGSSSNSTSSCSSHSSSHYYPNGSANVMEDDAFYIEMTPDSGQIAGGVHSDLLPMELLNVASNKHSTNSGVEGIENIQSLEWRAGPKATQSDSGIISNEEQATASLNHESVASSLAHCLPLNKLPPTTTRKFGLW